MEYALDRVLSVCGSYAATNSAKGITAGGIAFIADQVQNPSLSFTSNQDEIMDARQNVVMRLQNARGATFGAENAFFNTQILGQQTGGVSAVEAVEFKKYDFLVLEAGGSDSKILTLTATPAAASPTVADFKVYQLASDNSYTNAAALTGTTDYTYASGKITVIKASVEVGDKFLVVYEAKETGEHIVANADSQNELMDVTAEVLLRELCNEELYYAFIILRGKLSGEASWDMQRDSAHAFEIAAVPAYCDADKKLVEVIIVKGEDMLGD